MGSCSYAFEAYSHKQLSLVFALYALYALLLLLHMRLGGSRAF